MIAGGGPVVVAAPATVTPCGSPGWTSWSGPTVDGGRIDRLNMALSLKMRPQECERPFLPQTGHRSSSLARLRWRHGGTDTDSRADDAVRIASRGRLPARPATPPRSNGARTRPPAQLDR